MKGHGKQAKEMEKASLINVEFCIFKNIKMEDYSNKKDIFPVIYLNSSNIQILVKKVLNFFLY